MDGLAKLLILGGAILAGIGALLWLGQMLPPGLRPGRLPGDLRIERDGFRLYLPLTSMVLLSLLATGILWLIRWWRG